MAPSPINNNHSNQIYTYDAANVDEPEESLKARIGVMVIIFVVSLFASSFPSISKRVKFLRIPKIVFFIGKHFGTGVILSTAFVHLLQDAFSSLQHPSVKERWNIGKWTGLIVLVSLLSIFLVEYISTSYVDRLHSFSSLPSSPDSSRPSTPMHGHGHAHSHIEADGHTQDDHDTHNHNNKHKPPPLPLAPTENSPLIPPRQPTSTPPQPLARSQTLPHSHTHQHSHAQTRFFQGHHRHESRGRHGEHHERSPRIAAGYTPSSPEPENGHPHPHVHSHGYGFVDEAEEEGVGEEMDRDGEIEGDDDGCSCDDDDECTTGDNERVNVGRRRQVVGILVLQMGIMIHSLVIGLTLAITSGSEFTSLVTAIIFHQLFEGLSLGIRISSLPKTETEDKPKPKPKRGGGGEFSLLPVTLMILFAITTPIGIIIGLLTFSTSESSVAHNKLTQGLLCALSAGMLIYASCVEMLAGDFVMDSSLWRSAVWRQCLALGSLAVGVVGMSVIGIWQ